MGGLGNIEDNLIDLPDGAYRAVALRSYSTSLQSWAIWWLDGRAPHGLDTPVIGGFENSKGAFYAENQYEAPDPGPFPLAQQPVRAALGAGVFPDGGATWETNWVMDFTPQT